MHDVSKLPYLQYCVYQQQGLTIRLELASDLWFTITILVLRVRGLSVINPLLSCIIYIHNVL